MAMISETEIGEALADANIKQMIGRDVPKGRPLYGSGLEFNIIGRILWPQIVCRRSTIPTMAFGIGYRLFHSTAPLLQNNRIKISGANLLKNCLLFLTG